MNEIRHFQEVRRRYQRFILHSINIILVATSTTLESAVKEPYHTSALTGEGWVLELMSGHPGRIRCELGVHLHVFKELLVQLRSIGYTDSKYVTLEEQVAIFLYTCITGLTSRHVGERFQRSNQTISRYFRHILFAFSSHPFYSTYVHLPTEHDPIPSKIHDNPKFWPFFKDCLGALDGSHIHCSPPACERPAYRNRKGFLSQNCLFGCSFDLTFSYALTGWEGSATDARIYEEAESTDLHIPEGKYYLADAGYPLSSKLLVPYRGVRYHLAEWGRASVRPANKQELFNLRHASARNVIERIFGVLKRRFRILLLAPEYDLNVQARIPAALCAIHNFIAKYDPSEASLPENAPSYDNYNNRVDFAGGEPEQDHHARNHRDQIAEMMWQSYQQVCAERAEVGSDESLSDNNGDDDGDNNDDDDI